MYLLPFSSSSNENETKKNIELRINKNISQIHWNNNQKEFKFFRDGDKKNDSLDN